MLNELLVWAKSFVKSSEEWRRSSFEDNWRKYQRNADSIYDPELAKRKEPWQSKATWPVTASHRENAQAQLYKTEIGPKPPLEVKARPGLGGVEDQAAIIRDLILREREKSRYDLGRNDVLEDKTTYGSGFARLYFETKVEDRLVQQPIMEEVNPSDPTSIMRSMTGQLQVMGYKPVVQPQIIFRGVRFEPLSIWDVFPDPKSLKIKGHAIALRYNITYGEIVNGAKPTADGKPGYVLPEAVEKLRSVATEEVTPIDKIAVQSDRNITEITVARTDYQKVLICHELQARLPKKWVLIDGQDIDDPDALIPAVVRFHDLTVISVETNPSYDGEPNIYKDDYMPVAGQFYGRGIPEMLKDVQSVSTETINQRLDTGTVSLVNAYAVIEKALVDKKDLNRIGPGSVIRLKAQDGITGGPENLFSRIALGGIDKASFIEPQEWERIGEARTSITQANLGTEDNTDTTLGAQKIQLGVSSGKLAYIGMLSEADFLYDVTQAYYKLIYTNYQPEDVALAIGQERAATFIPMTPEQLENAYQYFFMGIFQMENKSSMQAGLAAIDSQFGMEPYFNRLEVCKAELVAIDQDPAKFIHPEAEAMEIMAKAEAMAGQMVEQQAAQEGGGKPPAKPGKSNMSAKVAIK